MRRSSRHCGFTLIELLVTVAILAIVAALALPSFEDSLRRNRVATATNELIASFSLARTEAIRSSRAAGICTSSDGDTCGGTWNDGWIVWTDADRDNIKDAEEPVVRYVQGYARLLLTADTDGAASTTMILFDRRGRPDNGGVERTFALQPDNCRAGTELVRNFTLNAVGQLRIDRENCT